MKLHCFLRGHDWVRGYRGERWVKRCSLCSKESPGCTYHLWGPGAHFINREGRCTCGAKPRPGFVPETENQRRYGRA